MFPDFKIFTWGSCRHGEVEIVYPKDLNLVEVTNRRGKHVVDLGAIVIEYDNRDSSKNMNRHVKIVEVREPVVIRYHGRSSCSKAFEEVWVITRNGARQVAPEEIREVVKVEENGKYRCEVLERYIELDGRKIVISRTVLKKEIIPTKASIVAKVKGTRIEVSGDTYHVRDILKQLKFRWDWINRVWYQECVDDADVGYTLLELEAQLKERGFSLVIENAQNH